MAEHFAAYGEKIAPKNGKVYRYLQFDELPGYGTPVQATGPRA